MLTSLCCEFFNGAIDAHEIPVVHMVGCSACALAYLKNMLLLPWLLALQNSLPRVKKRRIDVIVVGIG